MKPKVILFVLLFLGFLARLYKIDNPVADWHSWRQADTAAVTRNYVKEGISLLYPKYDDLSGVPGRGFNPQGFRFVEFPIYNLIHYSFFKIFGNFSLEIWGRLTTIFASLVSSLLIYLIVRRHTKNEFLSLLAVFCFLFLPFNVYYSRVILPDPLMVTFFLFAIYFSSTSFILTLVFSILAVLVKPVAIFFLFPVFFLYKFSFKSWIIGLLCFGSFGLWRWWSFHYPAAVPPSGWLLNGNHIRFRPAFFGWIFDERLGQLILGVWGLPLFVNGFLKSFIQKYSYFLPFAVSVLVYLFVFATGNVQHDYYQIPIIPSVSIFLAIGIYELWQFQHNLMFTLASRWLVIFSVAMMLYFAWYDVRGNGIKGYYQVNHWEIVHAGQAVNQITPQDAVVVAPYLGDTAFLYQTNRKGFPLLLMPIKDLHDRFNVTYYVSTNYDDQTNWIMQRYPVVAQTPEYVIVKITDQPKYIPE